MAMLAVVAVGVAEVLVVRAVAPPDRPVVGGAVLGGCLLAFAVAAVVWCVRCRPGRGGGRRGPPLPGDEGLFSAEALSGFPAERIRPLLRGPDAPDLNRLRTAWVLATQGYDRAWIAHHLELTPETAGVLVEAARERAGQAGPAR
ncbi:hypothetical protein SCATT_00270 [Streptantibioticus cattleyicolor NRRL 8057 = DSM 46488]|uniref:Uncharacterized protein n=2 Tax=Kitasatosporales TaxID=85011 RepID=G8WVV4_STREN|nr:hypothetical protein SCATT_00270 [Streptantibioticus cattleyicolor NRRL 8057 = DSM 46488]